MFLTIFLSEFPDPVTVLQKKFYGQSFDDIDKILIIGSSHTGNLNATLINEAVSNANKKYVIYNLSYNNDVPTKRLKTVDSIIEIKPKIVLYGISYHEFWSLNIKDVNIINSQQFYLQKFFLDKFNNDFSSPQFITLQLIREIGKDGIDESSFKHEFTPFFEYHSNQLLIRDNLEIEKEFMANHKEFGVTPLDNKEFLALKEIINKLQKNNIKVIIFTTPYQSVFLDSLPYRQKQEFNVILDNLVNPGITMYRLDERYADLSVWYNYDHIAYNNNSSVYSKDITEIILNEIEK
jgi:hypothetical protein